MRRVILSILLLFPIFITANPVEISGTASFFSGEQISISRYKNQLTKEKILVQSQIIKANGGFNLRFDIQQSEVIILKIEMREIQFHVHKGMKIKLYFLPFNDADNQRINMPYQIQYDYIGKNMAPDSIYRNVQDDFAQEQLKINRDLKMEDLYNSFFSHTDSIYHNYITNDSLFSQFYTYFKARAYLQTDIPKSSLIKQHIIPKSISYQSPEYLYFFNSVMTPQVDHVLMKHQNELNKAKNEYHIYTELTKIIGKDSLLRNEQIRDLALLLYIKNKASTHFFDAETKSALIGQLANFSPYPIHQEAARFFQEKTNTLEVGAEAPNFILNDIKGNEISLISFRGKPMYLGFIHTHSKTCQNNLMVLEKLHKKYRKMQFVLIVVDRDSSKLEKLIPQSSNLTFLYLNKDYSVLEQYQIWNFPVYYLLDKHGYFMQSPANFPDKMFPTFEKMFARKSRYKF